MDDAVTDGTGAVGQQSLNDSEHPYNTIDSFIAQALGRIGTIRMVKVKGVDEVTGLAPVGFVDVQPMINMVDGLLGTSTPHDTIFHIPYFRLQGGKNAFIVDPAIGDIGFMVVSDRDISAAKNARDNANPGSFRRFDLADGIYVGGILNDTPEQYVQFTDDGIVIQDKHGNFIKSSSSGWEIKGVVLSNDNLTSKLEVIRGVGTGDVVHLGTHGHPGNNLPPTPGS